MGWLSRMRTMNMFAQVQVVRIITILGHSVVLDRSSGLHRALVAALLDVDVDLLCYMLGSRHGLHA